jgi:hypothetical protein
MLAEQLTSAGLTYTTARDSICRFGRGYFRER